MQTTFLGQSETISWRDTTFALLIVTTVINDDCPSWLTLYPSSCSFLAVGRNLGWNDSWMPMSTFPCAGGMRKPVDIIAFMKAKWTVGAKHATWWAKQSQTHHVIITYSVIMNSQTCTYNNNITMFHIKRGITNFSQHRDINCITFIMVSESVIPNVLHQFMNHVCITVTCNSYTGIFEFTFSRTQKHQQQ